MKIAVVLFNLGGPDNPKAVEPFLYNLFNDEAIIRLPKIFRALLAKIISVRRAKTAQAIYAQMGGSSPILKNTEAQASALEKHLNDASSENTYKSFVAMRYWHPFADETARNVKIFAPERIILLPLYPQFSTTTTASSFKDWARAAKRNELKASTQRICCYPQQGGFIDALAKLTRERYVEAQKYGQPRILFSAHGLPEKIIESGDPYRDQCEMTVEALRRELGALLATDTVLCFQSRVGPLKWITPATEDEIRRAGQDKVPVVIVPIAFVSEHSETVVELDIEYRHVANEAGVPFYAVVPTVGITSDFIVGLAELVWGEKKDCICGALN